MSDERPEVIALEIMFAAVRGVRRISPDPARPIRQILDSAARDAERVLERHAGSAPKGVW